MAAAPCQESQVFRQASEIGRIIGFKGVRAAANTPIGRWSVIFFHADEEYLKDY
jgi:hypothetical protein